MSGGGLVAAQHRGDLGGVGRGAAAAAADDGHAKRSGPGGRERPARRVCRRRRGCRRSTPARPRWAWRPPPSLATQPRSRPPRPRWSATLLPQLAPIAARLSPPSRSASSVPVTPIMVRPAVSKLMVAVTGRSHAERAPRTAASSSSRSLMVSTHSTSAPPAARPSACSAKGGLARGCRHVAQRLEQLAGGPHRPGHQHRPARPLGLGVGPRCGRCGRQPRSVPPHRPGGRAGRDGSGCLRSCWLRLGRLRPAGRPGGSLGPPPA